MHAGTRSSRKEEKRDGTALTDCATDSKCKSQKPPETELNQNIESQRL